MIGICFGHELMAMVLGGEAGYHPDGMEVGSVPITLTDQAEDDPLFSQLPRLFTGHVTHSQTALVLPKEAVLLASSDHDAHQAFRFGECAWGLQFHPEFDAEAIRFYTGVLEDKLVEQGRDINTILSEVKETPESTELMPLFVEYCRAR